MEMREQRERHQTLGRQRARNQHHLPKIHDARAIIHGHQKVSCVNSVLDCIIIMMLFSVILGRHNKYCIMLLK